jgi:hypothetical protein
MKICIIILIKEQSELCYKIRGYVMNSTIRETGQFWSYRLENQKWL